MTLKQIRNLVKKSNFFTKSVDKLLYIIDNSNQKNYLTEDEKNKMIEIIDLEMEVANIKADLFEKVSLSIKNLIQNSKETTKNIETVNA